MTSRSWPPQLEAPLEAALIELANDYSLAHSLVYRPQPFATAAAIHAPYALFPALLARAQFERALQLQPLYNALYAHVAVDVAFLREVIGGAVANVDAFQRRLYTIWDQVEREGLIQPLHLGLFRSDYLVDCPDEAAAVAASPAALKQVEFNTISSSFGPLGAKVSELHRYLLRAGAYPAAPELTLDNLPANRALTDLAAGLAAGHAAYNVATAKILMVTQDRERNAFDQRALQWELLDQFDIGLVRLTLAELALYATLDPIARILSITHPALFAGVPVEISVVYYRSGYAPADYASDADWDSRLLVERSRAIKCPTIALQLAGAKKVQQVLAEPGRLETFLARGSAADSTIPAVLTPSAGALLSDSFTSLYPLDNSPRGVAALALAYAQPQRFVLKPQREGGGNNIYKADIPAFLDALAAQDAGKVATAPREREAYILMDLIQPPRHIESIMVRAGESVGGRTQVISELGIYGVALFSANPTAVGGAHILVNQTAGHLLRTKGQDSDEGGVAVGYSVIDSPCLV